MNDVSVLQLFRHALAAVDPCQAVLNALQLRDGTLCAAERRYELSRFHRIIVVGAGKASAPMAQAVEQLLGKRIEDGVVIVKYGHTAPLNTIRLLEAAHPVPDQAGVDATAQLLQLLHGVDEETLVICLLSGGASALLVRPVSAITLQDKQETTSQLLRAGASIDELNAVRKHLSAVKGGRLAQLAAPATVLTLIVSDVIGDRLDVIASGPTAPDTSTFDSAWQVIAKYGLGGTLPPPVSAYLQRGRAGGEAETLKHQADDVQNLIVAGNRMAMEAVRQLAQQRGVRVVLLSDRVEGEAREVAGWLAQRARAELEALSPGEVCCLLSGGETTVTVSGDGKGGRNQELALAFALEIDGMTGMTLLSAGTDGTDGPTDATGAVVDGHTVPLARRHGLMPEQFLAAHDSYTFFQQLDRLAGCHSHLKTGPTGTNVMDLQILLLRKG